MTAQLDVLTRVLDPADNTVGGGAASGIAGAMAAALTAMAARLSVRKVVAKPEAFYRELAAEAESLTTTLFAGADEDAQAFGAVSGAYRLPIATEEQKISRSRAIQDALVHAARVPLSNAEHCKRVLELCRELRGHCNPNVSSDLECAALLARAALFGCMSNLEANLRSIKDETARSSLEGRATRLRETGDMSAS